MFKYEVLRSCTTGHERPDNLPIKYDEGAIVTFDTEIDNRHFEPLFDTNGKEREVEVNLETATEDMLMELPSLTPKMLKEHAKKAYKINIKGRSKEALVTSFIYARENYVDPKLAERVSKMK